MVNFFISLADFPWLSRLRIFFSINRIKITGGLIFEASNSFLVDSVRFLLAELIHFKQKKLVLNFDAIYLANQTT